MSLTSLIYITVLYYVQVIAPDSFRGVNNQVPDDIPPNNVDPISNSSQTVPNLPNPIYLLPPVTSLPGREGKPVYTLVLDMDDTLMHYLWVNGKGTLVIRPHAEEFLKKMDPLYEIVIWTAGFEDYANPFLDAMDPNHYIDHKLYRNEEYYESSGRDPKVSWVYIKDLSKLGRDLNRTIIIDNLAQNFQRQPENGLAIAPYFNAVHDTALLDYIAFLTGLVEDNVADVRPHIAQYKKGHHRV